MTERYCRNCGAEVGDADRYCSDCGQKIDGADHDAGEDRGSREAWGTDNREADDGWDSGGAGGGGRYDSGTVGEQGYGRNQPDTTMAMLTHVLALFTWLIGPLVVYMATDDPFVRENAAKAADWQIMFTVYMLISFVLVFAVVGIFLVFILPLIDMAFILIAAVKANEGEAWTYPLTPSIL
jgi:uncharacterized Tic20 family protein